MQKWVMDNSERIIDTIVSETGKTYKDVQLAEISYGGAAFGFWAKNAEKYLADERAHTSSMLVKGKKLILRHCPLGLIGVIGPWNYPLVNSFGDCIPALAAGNAVILKPSEVTPLTSMLLAKGFLECGVPADVFQVATGRGDTGRALIDEVDMIMFTGSTRTGRKVAQTAAERLIPCSLELGGKDPMIVLADADWSARPTWPPTTRCRTPARPASRSSVPTWRRRCTTSSWRSGRQGARAAPGPPGGGPGTVEVGSMTFPPQVDLVEDHVNDALSKGARALTGGHRGEQNGGHYFEPTVLVDVDHSMKA